MQTGKPKTKHRQSAISDTHQSHFFGEVISRQSVRPNPQKHEVLTEMTPKTKKELQAFLRILIASKVPPSTAEVC